MKNICFALSLLLLVVNASADITCKVSKGKVAMLVECPDGRSGSLDTKLPTGDIIDVKYLVTLTNGKSFDVTAKGSELSNLVNGEFTHDSVYPLPEKLAPFMNKKLKTRIQKYEIKSVEPKNARVSPSIKIYDNLTNNGKQGKVLSYGNVKAIDAKPVAPAKSGSAQ